MRLPTEGRGMAVELRLLGTVQAHVDGQPVDLGSARQRCVFVALLVDANHIVPTEQLMVRVWGEDSPGHRATLYSYLSRLRSALAGAGDIRITHKSGGYLISVDPQAVDLFRFRDLVRAAGRIDDAGLAAAEYERGLEIWRGEAFAGLDTLWLDQLRAAVETERRTAELRRNDLMLSLGRHTDLLADLTARAAEHPLDEHIARQLMLALHRAGRRADALQVYQDTRTALVEELGLEPGTELRTLHQRMLAGDEEPAPQAVPTVVPRQLPADLPHFTGRAADLAELHARLERSRQVVITAIDGTAGVGKTSLAVHFGHQVAGRFPDGQLYLDLRGHAAGEPMTPAGALGLLLRGLGLPPDRIPAVEQEQAATYRSLLAGRRVLIVLDDAHSGAQIRPLLPGTPGCAVVITSRSTLSTVDGVGHLRLTVLSEREALDLLAALAGPGRVEQEPDAASAVIRMCARLPLAVRIAGARLAARPAWRIATLAGLLADEHRRLDELRVGDRAVRTSFSVSYQALLASGDPVDAVAARLFRLLGVLDWADMSVPVAAALLDVDQPEARCGLERLVDDRLLDSAAPGRYHTHDLLRLYASDLAAGEPDGREALTRALCCYLDGAEQANVLINPMTRHLPDESFRRPRSRFSLSSQTDATAWTDTERANLLAAVRQALTMDGTGPAIGVRLTATLNRPFDLRGYWHEFLSLRVLAAETAHRLGDRPAAAFAFQDLAWTYVRLGESGRAITSAQRALASWQETGDRRSEQACLNILGFALRQLERFDEALDCLQRAHTICQAIGHDYGEAATRNHLGLVYQRLRRFDEAIACHEQALAINERLDDQSGQATSLANLGWTHYRSEDAAKATDYYQRSLPLARAAGDRYQEGESLWGLGQSHHTLGNYEQARACWHRSIEILHDIGALSAHQATVLRGQPVPGTPEIVLRNT